MNKRWPDAGAAIVPGALMISKTTERIEGNDYELWNVYRFERWEDREGKERWGWKRVTRDPRGPGFWRFGDLHLEDALELMRHFAENPEAENE